MGLLNGRQAALGRGLRHKRTPEHLKHCADCQAEVLRERQYLERLRKASVPEASQELTARLIAQTRSIAESSDFGVETASRGRAAMVLRTTGIAAGGLLVSAGALAAAAYVVGGEPEPAAAGSGRDVRSLAGAPFESALSVDSRAAADPDGVILSAAQLEELRNKGWACPELSGMGFRVVSARATMQDGNPAVELELSDGTHHATLVEQHLPGDATSGAWLSVSQGTRWQAVYRSSVARLSYASDLPAERADDAVPELMAAGDSLLPAAEETAGNWQDRIRRGLRSLANLAGF
ncbi:hypothetical protein BIU82_02430 [Arthrobacter sp. SW1]|uniref:hypothetical protein n=1 Tax=Arthrobacter sp. SW1 TaxID=1920889 RepID=UPI000877D7A2|nr:hypothetical protein [Arthrobacter sp. SW1]OFI39917.1 hypothetical protein BIU82_02430 [Arthrobacter sp. SW1]